MVTQLELLQDREQQPGQEAGVADRVKVLEERRLAREYLHNLAEWLRSGRIREEAAKARQALMIVYPSGETRR